MVRSYTKNLVLSALFLALCILLPFLTGQVPQIGSMLLPMHIPVLLAGFFCGWQYGLLVGLIAPLMRSLLFFMPPMFPTAVAMAFELAAYGCLSGLLYRAFPKNLFGAYAALILAMLAGRAVWGAASLAFYGIAGKAFTFAAFLAGAFINALPGILLQLVLIPALVVLLGRAAKRGKAGEDNLAK